MIQKVVHDAFGRLQACYEEGLGGHPGLQGRVVVRFLIGHDGAVSKVNPDLGSTPMADAGVDRCVVREFFKLRFPEPVGGTITVTYPIQFAPGERAP